MKVRSVHVSRVGTPGGALDPACHVFSPLTLARSDQYSASQISEKFDVKTRALYKNYVALLIRCCL